MQIEPRRALAQTGALLMLGTLLSSAVILPLVGHPAHAQDPSDTAEDTVPADAPDEAGAPDGEPAAGGEPPAEEPPTAEPEAMPEAEAEPEAEPEADMGEVVLPGEESPWSFGLVTSMLALGVGGVSAVLGIWVDRDQSRPVAFAFVMSVLITAAITVGATQSYLDAISAIQHKQDLHRMLGMVSEIAAASGDAELAELVQAEQAE